MTGANRSIHTKNVQIKLGRRKKNKHKKKKNNNDYESFNIKHAVHSFDQKRAFLKVLTFLFILKTVQKHHRKIDKPGGKELKYGNT